VSFAAMGVSRVTATPIPNATIRINKKSGLRFTFYHSHYVPGDALYEALPISLKKTTHVLIFVII